ncbi:helix-turn-helix domain-containing protein [Mycobacterium sp. LTG2003]
MTGPHELELVRVETSDEAPFEPPHPATQYFSQRLQELSQNLNVRRLDGSGRVRKLTPLRLQKLLKEQAPDLPVSQTQIYRYYHGESAPRLDVVYELAALLGVSPREFLPPDTSE